MLADEIKKRIHGDVHTDSVTLDQFSHDASIFEVRPTVVVALIQCHTVCVYISENSFFDFISKHKFYKKLINDTLRYSRN
jgi:hypothetical protein